MNDPSCWREAETKPLVSGTWGVRTYAQTYMYTCTQACTRTHVCADTCLPCVLRLASTPTLGWRAARCGPAFLEGSWGVGGWCGVSGSQGQSVRTCRPCRAGRGQEGALQWSGVVLRQPGHRAAWPGARPASDSRGRGSDVSAGENERMNFRLLGRSLKDTWAGPGGGGVSPGPPWSIPGHTAGAGAEAEQLGLAVLWSRPLGMSLVKVGEDVSSDGHGLPSCPAWPLGLPPVLGSHL